MFNFSLCSLHDRLSTRALHASRWVFTCAVCETVWFRFLFTVRISVRSIFSTFEANCFPSYRLTIFRCSTIRSASTGELHLTSVGQRLQLVITWHTERSTCLKRCTSRWKIRKIQILLCSNLKFRLWIDLCSAKWPQMGSKLRSAVYRRNKFTCPLMIYLVSQNTMF